MKNCNRRYGKMLATLAVLCVVCFATLVSCTTTADYTLGQELTPGHQQMQMRHRLYKAGIVKEADKADAPCQIFQTRLFKTDSTVSTSLGQLHLGLQSDERFGTRKLSFASQVLFMLPVDDSIGFGYRPVYDSTVFRISVDTFAGDTTKPMLFRVYELKKELTNEEAEDTVFYTSFDPRAEGLLAEDAEPIFTFEFPNPDKGIYTSSTHIRMTETAATPEFIKRLLCMGELDKNGNATKNIEAYESDSAFLHNYYGLYVEAVADMPDGEGAVYTLQPGLSGIQVFGRTRNAGADEAIIADTIDMTYFFVDSYSTGYGNVSAQRVQHDFTGSELDGLVADDTSDERAEVELGYVEGCGGVITQLKFTDDFLYSLRNINSGDEVYSSAAVNQAALRIYIEGADYDYTQMEPLVMADKMNASLGRLGLYSNFKSLTPVADYLYVEESNGTTLAYDGKLNRSRAFYEMNISSYIQYLINELLDMEPKADGTLDFDSMTMPRTIYIAPDAYDLFTFKRSVLQGADKTINPASIELELVYTLVK
ncbi:MAG: DUF4270 family protein [Alistipes sp.]|nr:DUF4270 family protein [Alistipes sp.]